MNIRSRIEFFLAKIAGRDIDVNTLIPAGATNTVEELLLEIADRIGDAGAAPAAATADKAGVVKAAANVAYAAGEAPTAAEFKALIDALIAAGIMAAPNVLKAGLNKLVQPAFFFCFSVYYYRQTQTFCI